MDDNRLHHIHTIFDRAIARIAVVRYGNHGMT
jgi:hypothetical protein